MNTENQKPEMTLRNLTDTEVAAYQKDGVVCLKGVLAQKWVNQIDKAIHARTRDLSYWAQLLSKPDQGFFYRRLYVAL